MDEHQPVVGRIIVEPDVRAELGQAVLVGQIVDVLSEFRPLYETATAICTLLTERLGYDSSAILLERTGEDFLEIEGAAGLSSRYIAAVNTGYPIRISDPMLSEGPTSEAFRTNRPVTVSDVESDPRFRRWRDLAREQGIGSLISIPLCARDRQIGALNCYRARPHEYSIDEVRTLSTVASQVGLAIEIARMMHEQQETIERLDDLVRQLDRQQQLLERSEQIHERLTGLVLNNQGIRSIARELASVGGGTVVVQDAFFEVIDRADVADARHGSAVPPLDAWLPRGGIPPSLRASIAIPLEISSPDDEGPIWIVAPVVAGRSVLGYVSIALEALPVPPLVERAIGHAATVIALDMVKDRLAHETDVRVRRTFGEDLLAGRFNNDDRARARARGLSLDLAPPFQVVVVDTDEVRSFLSQESLSEAEASDLRRQLFDAILQQERERAPRLLVAGREEQLAVILTRVDSGSDPVTDIDTEVRAALQRVIPDLVIRTGVGRPVHELREIPTSFREANQALRAMQSLGMEGPLVRFEDLGLARLLLQVTDPAEITSFATSLLGPVIDYDRDHDGALISVLGAYLDADLSATKVAQSLGLHPNTVRYRIRKIESLLGVSLRDQSTLLDLHFAYKVLRLASGTLEKG